MSHAESPAPPEALPVVDGALCLQCASCVRCCPTHVLRPDGGRPVAVRPDRCIDCRHCTAVCPTKAIRFSDTAADYPMAPDSVLLRLIQTRRSVRTYGDELPDRGLIERALRGAAWAPSGKNIHDNGWSVLWGRDAVRQAYDMTLDWCRETGIYPELLRNEERGLDLVTCGAPCVIIGHNLVRTLNPVVDTAIAMTTAELLLVEKGLATCWGGYLRHALNDYAPLKAFCSIAEDREVFGVMMVGLPGEFYRNIPYRPEPSVHWIEG